MQILYTARMENRSETVEELREIAAAFIRRCSPGAQATVVALSGELGAGKTAFTQGVAHALGVTETVSSPTFVIEKIYDLSDSPASGWQRLIHIDAYRLKGESELEAIGWHEISKNKGNLIVIEWPERVPGLVPEGAIKINFQIAGDGRIITIDDGKESKDQA